MLRHARRQMTRKSTRVLNYFLLVLLDTVPSGRDKTPRLVEALLERIDSNNDNVAM